MNSTVKLDVRVYPIEEPKGATVAFANVGIDDMLAISGIRVVNSDKGNFVAMPQALGNNGLYKDIAFPVNSELRKELNKAVLAEFDAVKNDRSLGQSINAQISGERDVSVKVNVSPLKYPKGSTVAYANITVDNLIAINSARVISGENGNFVAMPQSKDKEGNYHDIAFPINKELRQEINAAVLAEFDKAQSRSEERGSNFKEKLAEGAQKAAQYAKPETAAAKGAPGLGD